MQNLDRRSDFTVTLLSPSLVELGSASVNDVLNGTNTSSGAGTPVILAFTAPIALSEIGAYTLRIKAGDYADINETWNHTAIDNLSINVPEPSSLALLALGSSVLLRRRRA